MQVINLIGGANVGKTTTALGLAYFMKRAGLRVEYVSEYAKDMTYEDRMNILADQLYILAKQNRRLHRLRGKMDWVITDGPLLLGVWVYARETHTPELHAAVRTYFNMYDNVTFFLPRNREFTFEKEGRVQKSHDEAAEFDEIVAKYLPENAIHLLSGIDYVDQALTHLGLGWEVPARTPQILQELRHGLTPSAKARKSVTGTPKTSDKPVDRRMIGTNQCRAQFGDDIYDRPA